MYCKNCGAKLTSNGNFCINCGSKIENNSLNISSYDTKFKVEPTFIKIYMLIISLPIVLVLLFGPIAVNRVYGILFAVVLILILFIPFLFSNSVIVNENKLVFKKFVNKYEKMCFEIKRINFRLMVKGGYKIEITFDDNKRFCVGQINNNFFKFCKYLLAKIDEKVIDEAVLAKVTKEEMINFLKRKGV